jgi:hypothetical protein
MSARQQRAPVGVGQGEAGVAAATDLRSHSLQLPKS